MGSTGFSWGAGVFLVMGCGIILVGWGFMGLGVGVGAVQMVSQSWSPLSLLVLLSQWVVSSDPIIFLGLFSVLSMGCQGWSDPL